MPGWKSSWTGTLQNADIQDFLQGQAVPRFADTTARDAGITAPDEGQMCFTDTRGLEIYQSTNIASAQWIRLWTPWSAYDTPTWSSGITSVDGTWDAVRRVEGGALHIRAQYTLGGSDSVTGGPIFNAAGYLTSPTTHISVGSASLRDTGSGVNYAATARCGIGATGVNIVYGSGIDATTPFTWAAGDLIAFDIVIVHPDLDAQ